MLRAVSCVLAFPYYYCSGLSRSDQTLTLYCSCDYCETLFSCTERLAGVELCPKAVLHHKTTVFLTRIHCHLQGATADRLTVSLVSLMITPTPIAKCLFFVAVSTQQIACDALNTAMWLPLGLVFPQPN